MRTRVLIVASSLLLSSIVATANSAREVTFSWEKLNEAIRYEFELSKDSQMGSVLERKTVQSNSVTIKVLPGNYFYRVRAIDRVEAPGKWTEPYSMTVDPPAVPPPKSIPMPVKTPSQEVVKAPVATPAPVPKKTDKIHGMQWAYRIEKGFALIEGSYLNSEKSLLLDGGPLERSENGRFTARIPMTAAKRKIRFVAVTLLGEVEEEVGELLDPEFGTTKRRPKRSLLMVGLGASSISYAQNLMESFSEVVLTGKVSYAYALNPQWDIGVNAFGTLLPISVERNNPAARFFGLNLRAGYALPFIERPWRLSLMGGGYFTTMYGTRDFGFRNQMGPQLFPTLSRLIDGQDLVFVYIKYSPVTSGLQFQSLSNREIAVGGGWRRPFGNERAFLLMLDYAQIQLKNSITEIGASSLTFSVGLGF